MNFIRKNRILFNGGIAFIIFLVFSFWIITYPYSLPAQPTQWTVQTLKEYVDIRFEAQKEAVDVALDELKEKFRNTNEWRGSQDDLIKTMQDSYVPKSAYESLKDQVDKLEKRQDAIDSLKKGQSSTIAWVIAAISTAGAIMLFSKNFIAAIFKPKSL